MFFDREGVVVRYGRFGGGCGGIGLAAVLCRDSLCPPGDGAAIGVIADATVVTTLMIGDCIAVDGPAGIVDIMIEAGKIGIAEIFEEGHRRLVAIEEVAAVPVTAPKQDRIVAR